MKVYTKTILRCLCNPTVFSHLWHCSRVHLYIYFSINAFDLDMQGFAENLFKLFDSDCSGAVSLQELVGGLGRLTV